MIRIIDKYPQKIMPEGILTVYNFQLSTGLARR